MLEPPAARLRGGRLLAGTAEASEAAVHRRPGDGSAPAGRKASCTWSRKASSGHLPISVNKVRGNHGNSPGESQEFRELDACPLREQGMWIPLLPHSAFLSVSLHRKDCGVPGAAHSALLGQDVLQALNGMGGDL